MWRDALTLVLMKHFVSADPVHSNVLWNILYATLVIDVL